MQNIMPMCPLSFCNNSSMTAARFATWTSVYGKLKQSCNKSVAQGCGVSPCGVESQLDDLCILFQVPDKVDGTTASPGRLPSLGLTLTAALAVAPGFRPCRGVQSSSPPSRSSHSSPCCERTCCLHWVTTRNPRWHSAQTCGYSWVWMQISWRFMLRRWLKRSGQRGHW